MARIRLLSVELDATRLAASERKRSIDTKSSFIVVAAGVLASATFTGLVTSRAWYLGFIPFVLTLASIVAAVVALWPLPTWAPSGRLLVDEWVENCKGPEALEDYLLEVKAEENRHRDNRNQKQGTATKVGFVLLILSLSASLAVAGLNAVTPKGQNLGQVFGPNPAATVPPTQTP